MAGDRVGGVSVYWLAGGGYGVSRCNQARCPHLDALRTPAPMPVGKLR